MVKKFVRIKAPPEFNYWLEKRTEKMMKLIKKGSKKNLRRLSKMDTMRIIAKTDGVEISDELFQKLKRMVGIKKC